MHSTYSTSIWGCYYSIYRHNHLLSHWISFSSFSKHSMNVVCNPLPATPPAVTYSTVTVNTPSIFIFIDQMLREQTQTEISDPLPLCSRSQKAALCFLCSQLETDCLGWQVALGVLKCSWPILLSRKEKKTQSRTNMELMALLTKWDYFI